VATELLSHNDEQIQAIAAKRFEGIDFLQAEDIANAIVYALAQPEHVSVNEILVRPSKQQG
jgi:NADP-dependent 3-hydroxy acid dehydrogenase YdfG